jgi:hypothetical protein
MQSVINTHKKIGRDLLPPDDIGSAFGRVTPRFRR